jgi:enoyl-CoA hydratase
MANEHVLTREWDGVLEVFLNRPEKLNALSDDAYKAIRGAVETLRNREDLRVMLIRASGRYFSAGADLVNEETPDFGHSPTVARNWMRRELGAGTQALYEEMERVEKPIVVAHHAACLGGGLELSLSCDFRLAAKSAFYWFPEMQLGMLPLSNGLARMTRICGGHWTKWMVMANEKVSADRALMMGLVHDVYPDDTFEEDVRAFCRKLAGFPAEILAAGKLAIEMVEDLPGDQGRQLERLVFSSLVSAPAHKELFTQVQTRLEKK